jgi:tetratricopeptide (TPR) repeat protein
LADRADPLADALRSDEGVLRLAHGLALSERFHFYLLVCDTPRVASAALDVLVDEVATEREEPVRLIRLDPYRAHAELDKPIPFELLAEEVLARLVSPAGDERTADVLFVVDASRALPQDEEGWGQLFQRMNERRNGIAKALKGSLVLVVPGRLEAVFAHAAPDFWSIRSLAVVVHAPPATEAGTVERAEDPRARGSDAESEQDWGAAEIEAEVEAARARIAKDPEDDSALSALIVWLDRQVQHEMDRGTLDRALRAAEDSVLLERRRTGRDPQRAEWLHNLAVGLDAVGDVHLARGDIDRAMAAYEESLSLKMRLLARDPERAEWARDISVSLNRVGDIRRARGDIDRALTAYEESLSLVRRVLARDPERAEWVRDISASLDRVGDVYLARGDIDRALTAYEESLTLGRRLLARDPERAQWVRDISISLNKVG